jgi:transposase-like protein
MSSIATENYVGSVPKKQRKKSSRAEKIRRMINEGGHSVGDIARKVGVSRQYVYTTRYHMRKEQGLGAISNEVPAPTIGFNPAPTKAVVSYPKQGTGINQPPSLWSRIWAWVRG